MSAPAPDFQLRDLAGKEQKLSDYRGKVVLLDFWATWCGPCLISTPLVQQLYERHEKQGFVVLGMNMDEDASGVYAFANRMGMTYPVLFAGQSPVAARYGLEGLPLFILINKEGKIVRRFDGFSPMVIRRLNQDIEELLGVAKPS